MKLSNGQLIPSVGLGTWQVKGDQVKLIIKEAIRMGCRHLDCAAIYENEQQVGQALRETFQEGLVKRSDVKKTLQFIFCNRIFSCSSLQNYGVPRWIRPWLKEPWIKP